MGKALVSVIMPVYSEKEQWIQEAIESILNQTYRNLELIIVLDHPNNKKLKNVIKLYQKKDSRIKFFNNRQNIGVAKTLNFAITKCHGKYIARMDADDISFNNRLEEQLFLLERENVDIVGANALCFDNEKKIRTNLPLADEDIKEALKTTNPLMHSCWFLKKEIYEKMKGYRNVFLCEDFDFLLRCYNEGYKFANSKYVLLKYRMRKESLSFSNLLKQKKIMFFLIKNIYKISKLSESEINSSIANISTKQENKYITSFEAYLKFKHTKKVKYLFTCLKSIDFIKINILPPLKAKIMKGIDLK